MWDFSSGHGGGALYGPHSRLIPAQRACVLAAVKLLSDDTSTHTRSKWQRRWLTPPDSSLPYGTMDPGLKFDVSRQRFLFFWIENPSDNETSLGFIIVIKLFFSFSCFEKCWEKSSVLVLAMTLWLPPVRHCHPVLKSTSQTGLRSAAGVPKQSHRSQRESQRDTLDPCGVYSRKPPGTFRYDTYVSSTEPPCVSSYTLMMF